MKREIDIAQHARSDVDEPATFEDEKETAAEVTAMKREPNSTNAAPSSSVGRV